MQRCESLSHAGSVCKRRVVLILLSRDWQPEAAADPQQCEHLEPTGPNGAFRYVSRPPLGGRPKPRPLDVVDYWVICLKSTTLVS